jgi:hypothetical protein
MSSSTRIFIRYVRDFSQTISLTLNHFLPNTEIKAGNLLREEIKDFEGCEEKIFKFSFKSITGIQNGFCIHDYIRHFNI